MTNRQQHWLWPGRLPATSPALLDGEPGHGKSLLSRDLLARLSSGRPMPGQRGGSEPRRVAVFSTLDSFSSVVVPQLRTAGANQRLVNVIRSELRLPRDLPALAQFLFKDLPAMLVIDSLEDILEFDWHDDLLTLLLLDRLKELGKKSRCCIVLTRVIYPDGSWPGSTVWEEQVPVMWRVVGAPAGPHETPRTLMTIKSAARNRPADLPFRIEDVDGYGRLVWQENSEAVKERVS